MSGQIAFRLALAFGSSIFLAGCEEGFQLPFGQGTGNSPEAGPVETAVAASGEVEERDVEMPEIFQVTEAGLWDGRPSLGGVWVAHPDVGEPERVIVRNMKNDTTVIGALFKRERVSAGPALQVSSDAAAALEILAGQPTQLEVTALRREAVPVDPPPLEATTLAATETIESETLDPIASAAAALDAVEAEDTGSGTVAAAAPAVTPKPRPKATASVPISEVLEATAAASPAPAVAEPTAAATSPGASSLAKPFIQIGIFSVEENAEDSATKLRQAGVIPIIRKQASQGKTFWRVLVGPATNSAERADLLKKVKGVGFADAYLVAN